MDYGSAERNVDSGLSENIDVVALAIKALSVLAKRDENSPQRTHDARIRELCEAFVHADDNRRHTVISRMIAAGISSTEIVDQYVPKVARRLGEAWVDSTLSFSDVTIGTARLQETVRSLGSRVGQGVTVPLGHRILLVIPQEENHTLGAFVAASQFRRYGLWVHMSIGQTPGEVAETVRSDNFEMIGISGSGRRSLESIRQIVEAVKTGCPFAAPVIVGGSLCSLDLGVQELTGADYVTTNPRKALGYCGLTVNPERAICQSAD